MRKRSLRAEIAAALNEGFGDMCRTEPATAVFVNGYADPIVVLSDDVIVPESLKVLAPSFRLDVQTILAGR